MDTGQRPGILWFGMFQNGHLNQATSTRLPQPDLSARNEWDFSLIRLNLHVARMAAGEPDGPSLHSQILQFRCMVSPSWLGWGSNPPLHCEPCVPQGPQAALLFDFSVVT